MLKQQCRREHREQATVQMCTHPPGGNLSESLWVLLSGKFGTFLSFRGIHRNGLTVCVPSLLSSPVTLQQ